MTFIRHGESEANIRNLWGGDYPLTEEGRQQALMVEAQHGPVVMSGLKRAQETARIACPEESYITDETFNEIWFGDVEDKEIDFEGEIFKSFIREPQSFHKKVNGDDIEQRARVALAKAMTYPGDTVFFTHGTLMQAMRSIYLYGTVEMMHKDRRFQNCEMWRVNFTE